MKDMKALVLRAQEQGWRVERTSKGHLKFIPPLGTGEIVIASGTPSDHRELKNTISRMKRAGFKLG